MTGSIRSVSYVKKVILIGLGCLVSYKFVLSVCCFFLGNCLAVATA